MRNINETSISTKDNITINGKCIIIVTPVGGIMMYMDGTYTIILDGTRVRFTKDYGIFTIIVDLNNGKFNTVKIDYECNANRKKIRAWWHT